MKIDKKRKARELRRRGLSLNEIKNKVKASKSSVSIWVRDIELTEEQLKQLKNYGQKKAGEANRKNALLKRKQYQLEGRELARQKANEPLFVGGLMLYWAEGAKSRSQADFTNSDLEMHKYYMKFLRKYFPNQKLSACINCYIDIHNYENILDYWSSNLGLDKSIFTKPQINNSPKSSSKKSQRKQKLPFGTLKIRFTDVRTLQQFYGAIQEIAGFTNPAWAAT
tara:strand:+ start:342 stop:1013 length:672 start_codon:yes stop_codon:yes gene_type:complete